MFSRRRFIAASAAASAAALAPSVRAQTPVVNKTARIVVGFPPGGSTDVVSRLIADRLRGVYAPSVIVENRPGAGGRIALEAVKNADADGSAMILTPASMLVIYPHIFKKLAYDPFTDFAPVTSVCAFPIGFSVGPMVPESVKTVADFVAWAKANPKSAAFASPAAGSMVHFTGVMLNRAAGLDMTHVPFKGGAPAIQDLIGGQIASSMNVLSEALPQHKAGKLRTLATSGAQRSPFMPDVPTFVESGYKEIVAREWFGILVPAKTPADIITKLNAAILHALKSKEVTEGFAKLAFDPVGESPADFARIIKADYERWAPIVKASGFTADE